MKFSAAAVVAAFAVSASAFTISMNSYLDSCGSGASQGLTSFANYKAAPAPMPATPIAPSVPAPAPAAPYTSVFADLPANSDLNYLATMGGGSAMKSGPNFLGMSKTFRPIQATGASGSFLDSVGSGASVQSSYSATQSFSSYSAPAAPQPVAAAQPAYPGQGAASMPKGKYSMTNASWKTSSPSASPAYSGPTAPAPVAAVGAAVQPAFPVQSTAPMPKGKYSMTNASWKTSSPSASPAAFGASVAAPKGKYSMTNASWKTSSPSASPSAFAPAYGGAAAPAQPAVAPAAPAAEPVSAFSQQTSTPWPKGKYSMTNASWKTSSPSAAPSAFAPAYSGGATQATSFPKGKYSMTNASWKTSSPSAAPSAFAPAYGGAAAPAPAHSSEPEQAAMEVATSSHSVASIPKGKYSMTNASWKTSSPSAAPSAFAPAYGGAAAPAPAYPSGGGGSQASASIPKGKYSMTNASWKTSSPSSAPSGFAPSYGGSAPAPAYPSAPEPAVAVGGGSQASVSMPKGKYSMTNASWKTSSPGSSGNAFAPAYGGASAPATPSYAPAPAASMPKGKYSMTNASWKTSSSGSSNAFAPAYGGAAAPATASYAPAPAPQQAVNGGSSVFSQASASMPKGKYSMTNASWKSSSSSGSSASNFAPAFHGATAPSTPSYAPAPASYSATFSAPAPYNGAEVNGSGYLENLGGGAVSSSYGAMQKSFAVASGKPRASTGMTNAGYLNAI